MKKQDTKLIPISKAAKMLGVALNTLRRWDKEGSLKSIRFTPTGNRYYLLSSLEQRLTDIFNMAKQWVFSSNPPDIDDKYFCPDSSIFQARLHRLESEIKIQPGLESDYSYLTAIAGEIGNNAFDHNLGSWPEIRGLLFAYDLPNRKIALADRGRGILATLKKVRPALNNDADALTMAFTETISGRAPESRGNGLKYVKLVITDLSKNIPIELYFQSGQAALKMKQGDTELEVFKPAIGFTGCLALINF